MDLNSKKDIYIVDLLAEKGHVAFVKQLIGILNKKFNVLLIGSSSYCQKIGHFHENTIALNDNLFHQRNKFHFVAKQLILIRKIQKILPKNGIVMVTGFENISYSIGWKRGAVAFLHNNIDKKGISEFFFKRINKKVTFIVYEEYIKDFLQKIVHNRIALVPHPISFEMAEFVPNKLSNSIFAINVNLGDKSFDDLVSFAERRGMQLFVKSSSKKEDIPQHVHIKGYYEDYVSKLKQASFVAIYAPYNYRVSGVFYECMSLNKKIYFMNTDTLFPIEMQKQYPLNVEFKELDSIKNLKPDGGTFFRKHKKERILKALTDVISE